MKTNIKLLALIILMSQLSFSQDVTTVEAKNSDISDNLDLEAVATIFGEAKDLEEFEMKLNDPETQISNLDLNQDGKVDYIRVVETSENDARVIVLQAIIWKDEYQDIATIEVDLDKNGKQYVQVVGDVYMYGDNYIIEPVYVHRPQLYFYLYRPMHSVWVSPYYWNYYPTYYYSWAPYHINVYHHHIHKHINHHYTYHYTDYRRSATAARIHRNVYRNDYGRKHPNRTFASRNPGVKNRGEIGNKRVTESSRPNNRYETRTNNRPATKPTVRPNSNPNSRSSTKPTVRSNSKPNNRSSSQSNNKEVRQNKTSNNRNNARPVRGTSNNKTSKANVRTSSQNSNSNTRPASKPKTSKASGSSSKVKSSPRPQAKSSSPSSSKSSTRSSSSTKRSSSSSTGSSRR